MALCYSCRRKDYKQYLNLLPYAVTNRKIGDRHSMAHDANNKTISWQPAPTKSCSRSEKRESKWYYFSAWVGKKSHNTSHWYSKAHKAFDSMVQIWSRDNLFQPTEHILTQFNRRYRNRLTNRRQQIKTELSGGNIFHLSKYSDCHGRNGRNDSLPKVIAR